jgi:hypothetical protein
MLDASPGTAQNLGAAARRGARLGPASATAAAGRPQAGAADAERGGCRGVGAKCESEQEAGAAGGGANEAREEPQAAHATEDSMVCRWPLPYYSSYWAVRPWAKVPFRCQKF